MSRLAHNAGPIQVLIAALAALLLAAAVPARAQMPNDQPGKSLQTVNALLDDHAGKTVHLILVHGIRTADRHTWDGFRAKLCNHLAAPHTCVGGPPKTSTTERLILAKTFPAGSFLGRPIWKTDQEFAGSQPFVDHWDFLLKDNTHLILDEVNWWPLALALKCQFLIADDTDLAGVDKDNIGNCTDQSELHYPWFSRQEARDLEAAHHVSGGAPLLNRILKTEILDWGISDAVLSLGTMKGLLRETIRCAFDDVVVPQNRVYRGGDGQPGVYDCIDAASSAQQSGRPKVIAPDLEPGSFIIASHSLGAFLLLDTFAAAAADAGDSCQAALKSPVEAYREAKLASPSQAHSYPRNRYQSLCLALAGSNRLYFFANQFALLELGRVQGLDGAPAASTTIADALGQWAAAPDGQSRRQVAAFSDPGDLLTFKVPPITGADIFNFYPHNDIHWLGLVEWPATAHTKYLTNDDVLRVMFGK